MTGTALISPKILRRFRDHPAAWRAEWIAACDRRSFRPYPQPLSGEVAEAIAALFWWRFYGAAEADTARQRQADRAAATLLRGHLFGGQGEEGPA